MADIDDNDPLRGFRSHLTELDDERDARMRQRVMAMIETSDTPASSSGTDRASAQAAPEADRLAAYPVGDETRRRHGSVLLVAAVVALVILAAVGVAIVGRVRSTAPVNNPPADQSLKAIAQQLATVSDSPLEGGQFQYRKVRSSPSDLGGTVTEETWIAADGTGRVRRTQSGGTINGPTGTTGPPVTATLDATSARSFDGWNYLELRALPTDPSALRGVFEGTSKIPLTDHDLGRLAVNVASWTATPPKVRAAAVELLDDLGYQHTGLVIVADHEGDSWTLTSADGSDTVVFDMATLHPIAQFETPVGAKPGDVTASQSWTVYEASDIRANSNS